MWCPNILRGLFSRLLARLGLTDAVWILNREEQLAGLFTIEVEFRAELSNHLHIMLRTRPELAKRLAPREVARRWLTITKLAKCMTDDMPVPDEKKIDEVVGNKKRIAELRKRLSSISWFMGILLENIAELSVTSFGTFVREFSPLWSRTIGHLACQGIPMGALA